MTTTAPGAHFEIKVNDVVRTHRDDRGIAKEALDFSGSAIRAPRSSSRTCETARRYRSTGQYERDVRDQRARAGGPERRKV
jgi:hypothetical protein